MLEKRALRTDGHSRLFDASGGRSVYADRVQATRRKREGRRAAAAVAGNVPRDGARGRGLRYDVRTTRGLTTSRTTFGVGDAPPRFFYFFPESGGKENLLKHIYNLFNKKKKKIKK